MVNVFAAMYGLTYGMGMILMLLVSSEMKDSDNRLPPPWLKSVLALFWLPVMVLFFACWVYHGLNQLTTLLYAKAKVEWDLRRRLRG